MKINYVANHQNTGSDNTEEHIYNALIELGHEVNRLSQETTVFPDADIMLFHKWIPPKDNRFVKVCWYFDKLWKDRPSFMQNVLENSDHVFLTDETWAKSNPNKKIHILRQGCGDKTLGNKIKGYRANIIFTGSVYGERVEWVNNLKERYGNDFRALNTMFNRDLNDLCATVPIFVAPPYPSDDYYWSNRVYEITGRGGFLIHPRLKGLEAEYNEDEIVFYDNEEDMFAKIDYYLENPDEREFIRQKGHLKTPTYKDRVKQLLCQI